MIGLFIHYPGNIAGLMNDQERSRIILKKTTVKTILVCSARPLQWVKQECKIFFNCYSVDEFRTSQICLICNNCLWDVRKHLRSKLHGKTLKIRGLKAILIDTWIVMMSGVLTFIAKRGLPIPKSWVALSLVGTTIHRFTSTVTSDQNMKSWLLHIYYFVSDNRKILET